jgi:hypothetical protein
MNAMTWAAVVPLIAITLGACSVTPKPQNAVLAPEQQQLGKRRINTSATASTPEEAVKNVITEGTGAVPVILIKSDKLFVQHVFDVQASFDTCMSLMSDRVAKSKLEKDDSGRRSYYCVPIEDGRTGSPTLVSQAEG